MSSPIYRDRLPAGPDNCFEQFMPVPPAFRDRQTGLGLRSAECVLCPGDHATDNHDTAWAYTPPTPRKRRRSPSRAR